MKYLVLVFLLLTNTVYAEDVCSSYPLVSAEGQTLGLATQITEEVIHIKPCNELVNANAHFLIVKDEIFTVQPGDLVTYKSLKLNRPPVVTVPTKKYIDYTQLTEVEYKRMQELSKLNLSYGGPITLTVFGGILLGLNAAVAATPCEEDNVGDPVNPDCPSYQTLSLMGAGISAIMMGVGIGVISKRAHLKRELKALKLRLGTGANISYSF